MPAPRVSRGDMSKSDSSSFSTPNTSPGGEYVTRLVIIRNHLAPWGSISIASKPISEDQIVGCDASIFTFGLGCGHCLGICSTVDMFRFCVLSLHREVAGVRQYTR